MIKINHKTLIESGKQIVGSKDIELCGCGTLKKCKVDYLEEFAKKDNPKFSQCFESGQKFFYHIAKKKLEQTLSFEVGVGVLISKNKKFILQRKESFYYSKDGQNIFPDNFGFLDFTCFDDEFLVVSQYIPLNYIELLYEPHSIIASKESMIPMSFNVEKNSIIGRLDDTIQSMPLSTLLNQIIKYDENSGCVEFFNGQRWIKLVEKTDENPS